MKLKHYTTLLLIIGSFVGIFAQKTHLSVDVQYRPRFEYNNGYKYPLEKDELSSSFINHRARLGVNYKKRGLNMRVSLQNVSVWGSEGLSPNANTVFSEAWAKLKSTEGLFVKIGRQYLHYDDGRIFSKCNWGQNGKFHDVVKLGFENGQHTLHGIFAFNQDSPKLSGGTYYQAKGIPHKTMQVLYYQYKNRVISPSVMFVNLGFEDGDFLKKGSVVKYMQTVGGNLVYHPNSKLMLRGTGYYQFGEKNKQSISAFLASINMKYWFIPKLSMKLGTDYLSGDSSKEKSYNAFSNVYGGHHGIYGTMDYFYSTPFKHGINPGLWDKYIGFDVSPFYSSNVNVMYHHFSTVSDVEKFNKNLGSEIDLRFDYKAMRDVTLSVGYSTFLGTKTMDVVKGGDHTQWQDWGWLQINIHPKVFFRTW